MIPGWQASVSHGSMCKAAHTKQVTRHVRVPEQQNPRSSAVRGVKSCCVLLACILLTAKLACVKMQCVGLRHFTTGFFLLEGVLPSKLNDKPNASDAVLPAALHVVSRLIHVPDDVLLSLKACGHVPGNMMPTTPHGGCRQDAEEAPEALGGIITTSFGPNKAPSGLTKARVTGEQAPLTAQGQSLRYCFNLLTV